MTHARKPKKKIPLHRNVIEFFTRRVTLKNSAISLIKIDLNGSEAGAMDMIINVVVQERDTGELITVMHPHHIPPFTEMKEFVRWFESKMELVFLHELWESYHVDGVRVNDPHKNDPPPAPPIHKFTPIDTNPDKGYEIKFTIGNKVIIDRVKEFNVTKRKKRSKK